MSGIQQDLKRLAADFKGGRPSRVGSSFASRLAQALKWREDNPLIRTQTIKRRGLPVKILQTFLGEQPAVLFASHRESKSDGVVAKVALCAYHSAIEWGVVSNPSETVVFNSHWVKNKQWFRLPAVSSAHLLESSKLFEALTPEGMQEGRIGEFARSQVMPDDMLIPVDDRLVDSLDRWRDEALKFGTSLDTLDERLQHLFAQLFVLRAVEDRGLAPEIPRLSTCLGPDDTFDSSRLKTIFREARRRIQSELFEKAFPPDVQGFVLKGVIEDLYQPRDFPIADVQYNFSWIEADVLGRAYEKYLASALVPSRRKDPQMWLFDQPLRDVQRVSRRKIGGVYYTPEFIVRYLTEKALDSFFKKQSNGTAPTLPHVVDLSCGSGSFLRAAAESLIRRLRQRDKVKNWGRELVRKKAIVGIDIDHRAVTLARLSLWLRLTEEPKALPLPDLNKVIVCGDSLRKPAWKGLPETYDIVLGNPPFLAATEAQLPAAIRAAFRSAQGRFDFSSLFVEQAVAKLKEGGCLGYVIPNRLFKNTYASEIRRLITESMRIITLVDFGSTEVFSGTSTYVALIFAEKDSDPTHKTRVRVIDVNSLLFAFPTAVLMSGDVHPQTKIASIRVYDAHHPTGEAPWNLLSDKAIEVRVKLESDNQPLASIATVAQGIKTGANDIFVVTIGKPLGSGLCEITNGLGDHHWIEEAILRPVVYGSEIQRYDVVEPQRHLIYPYLLDRPIPDKDLKNTYPQAYDYLSTYREFLTLRRGIEGTSYAWYELVRRRQSNWLEAKKIVIRELATYPCFALDAQGGTYLIGGTAVVPTTPDLIEPLLAFLNSRLSGWYLEKWSPTFQGGYSKFEPNTIQQLPVPRSLMEQTDFREGICDAVGKLLRAHAAGDEARQRDIEDRIDHLFSDELGIDLDEID